MQRMKPTMYGVKNRHWCWLATSNLESPKPGDRLVFHSVRQIWTILIVADIFIIPVLLSLSLS